MRKFRTRGSLRASMAMRRGARQGLDLQLAEKGRQDEVQLRPVSRLDQIGDEVSLHQENVRAEEAGEPRRLLGVRDDEDFNRPGIADLPSHFEGGCAQYREGLWRDPGGRAEQFCPVNLHRPPHQPESHKQASSQGGKRDDAGQTQQHDQAEAHEQDRCRSGEREPGGLGRMPEPTDIEGRPGEGRC